VRLLRLAKRDHGQAAENDGNALGQAHANQTGNDYTQGHEKAYAAPAP